MRRRRAVLVLVFGTALLAFLAVMVPSAIEQGWSTNEKQASLRSDTDGGPKQASSQSTAEPGSALQALNILPEKGRAPKTGYSRAEFGDGWATVNGCSTRDIVLYRDLQNSALKDECTVESGVLQDAYTGKTIQFSKQNSSAVQIDHVVALSDAWQKGASQLSPTRREQLANDPLELLAVDGAANQAKSDGDAAAWLPSNKPFRCHYVARQITVKKKYDLWVTSAEKVAIRQVLDTCPEQALIEP
jgi:hypothetical protein